MATLSEIQARQRPVRRTARTSNTILAGADCGKLFDVTSGTFSQTFTAAATLGASWWVDYINSGSGVVTLDPNSSETIAGASTYTLGPGQGGRIFSDGTNLQIQPFINVVGFTAAGAALLDDADAAAQRATLGVGWSKVGATITLSGTSQTRTDIPAGKRIRVSLRGVSASADGSVLLVGYSVNNGSGYTTYLSQSIGAGSALDGFVDFTNFTSTDECWAHSVVGTPGSSNTVDYDAISLASAINAIRVSISGGASFDAGTASVWVEN